jgi:hypothetical protein
VAAFACHALSEPKVGTSTESNTPCAAVWAAAACDTVCEADLNAVWDASCEAGLNVGCEVGLAACCEAGLAANCETILNAAGCEGV